MTPEEKIARYEEIERRGLLDKLPPEKQQIWAELKRRRANGAQVEQQPAPDAQPAQEDEGFLNKLQQYIPVAAGPAFISNVYDRLQSGDDFLTAVGDAYGKTPQAGILETGATMATGLAAEAAGGLRGTVTAATEGMDAGADAINETRETMVYMPRTEAGQRNIGRLGVIGDAIQGLEEGTGNTLVDAGAALGVDRNSPEAAALYATGVSLPTAVSEVFGLGLAKKATSSTRTLRQLDNRPRSVTTALDDIADGAKQGKQGAAALDDTAQRVEPKLSQQPMAGRSENLRQAITVGDKEGAAYRIAPNGAVVKDKLAKQAMQQGYSDRTVAAVKAASGADRASMLKMLDEAERGLNNAGYRARHRPSDVIGDNVMKRWKVISDANKKARTDIRKAAQQELRGKRVDVSDAVQGFVDELDDLGVTFADDGKPVFMGSQLEGNSATGPIKVIAGRLKMADDGLSLHRLKQYIDGQLDWNKSPDKPLDSKAVDALKRLRGRINEKLKETSKGYADANARASETFQVMDDMMDVMGARRFAPDADNAATYVGQEMRKVLSNYQKRADMIQAIDKLDEVAGKYGGKFADDPVTQAVFFSDMERLFGSFADNSFQGGVEKGVGRAAQFAQTDTTGKAVMAIQEGIDRARGINEANAIAKMRELLKRSNAQPAQP